jgi:hypothetical protein
MNGQKVRETHFKDFDKLSVEEKISSSLSHGYFLFGLLPENKKRNVKPAEIHKKEEDLHQEIDSVLKTLKKEGVPFYIVGGMALVLHGIPRTTIDIDMVIPSEKNVIISLFDILYRFKFHSDQRHLLRIIDKPEFLAGQWITFTDNKNREILDVYLENTAEFAKFHRRCERIKTKSLILDVATLKDVKKMKKETGRLIDLADIALIEEKVKYNQTKHIRKKAHIGE